MRTPTPLTTPRRAAAVLATSLLLGACWSDIKERDNNDADDVDPLPTAYDSAAVPGATIPPASVGMDSAGIMDTMDTAAVRPGTTAVPPPR